MRIVRHAAAGIVAAAAAALAVSAVVAFAAGGLFWDASLYAAVALALFGGARRLRPRRQRFLFARRA
jgi:hypothetical protein